MNRGRRKEQTRSPDHTIGPRRCSSSLIRRRPPSGPLVPPLKYRENQSPLRAVSAEDVERRRVRVFQYRRESQFSQKEIPFCRPEHCGRRSVIGCFPIKTANQCGWSARRLTHSEPCRCGKRVGGGEQRDAQTMSIGIRLAAEIQKCRNTADSYCRIQKAVAPDTAKSVRYDHAASQLTRQYAGRPVRVFG